MIPRVNPQNPQSILRNLTDTTPRIYEANCNIFFLCNSQNEEKLTGYLTKLRKRRICTPVPSNLAALRLLVIGRDSSPPVS